MLALLLGLASACLELDVDPPEALEPPAEAPPQSAPALRVEFTGEQAHRPDFATAQTMYRIFYSRMINQSGSLAELLRPAIESVVRRKGYRIGSGGRVLRIDLERAILLWRPPREFIQTPQARSRGVVLLDIAAGSRLYDRDPASGWPYWGRTFEDRRELPAFPGDESQAMELAMYQSLTALVRQLEGLLPPAR